MHYHVSRIQYVLIRYNQFTIRGFHTDGNHGDMVDATTTMMALHHTTQHHTTLLYTTLHYTTLHYNTTAVHLLHPSHHRRNRDEMSHHRDALSLWDPAGLGMILCVERARRYRTDKKVHSKAPFRSAALEGETHVTA